MTRDGAARTWVPLLLLLLAPLSGPSAAGQDQVPRRPPEPFRVFVHAIERADATLKARLDEALPMVRERVEGRPWFRLAESAETADIALWIYHYRQGHPRNLVKGFRHCWFTEYHYVDAVAVAGEARTALSGLDHRCVDVGPSLRNAAGHLAEELERFAKDNYGDLSRVKAQANEKQPGETPK